MSTTQRNRRFGLVETLLLSALSLFALTLPLTRSGIWHAPGYLEMGFDIIEETGRSCNGKCELFATAVACGHLRAVLRYPRSRRDCSMPMLVKS